MTGCKIFSLSLKLQNFTRTFLGIYIFYQSSLELSKSFQSPSLSFQLNEIFLYFPLPLVHFSPYGIPTGKMSVSFSVLQVSCYFPHDFDHFVFLYIPLRYFYHLVF